jgi:hypothetical protein
MPRTFDSTLRYSGDSDVVAYTTSSVQSAAVPANFYEIRVVCTSNAWINIGTDPTATAGDDSLYMPAGLVEYFHVSPGQKVAVIQDSGGGNLVVGFMTR